jgi:hypothetical protein
MSLRLQLCVAAMGIQGLDVGKIHYRTLQCQLKTTDTTLNGCKTHPHNLYPLHPQIYVMANDIA